MLTRDASTATIMGDELLSLHVNLINPGIWQKNAAAPNNGSGDASSLASSSDLNVLVSAVRASAKENSRRPQYDKEVSKLKFFVRSNHWPVSHEIRSSLWRTLCGVRSKLEREDYESLSAEIFGPAGSNRRSDVQLPSFVSPELTLNYNLNEDGVRAAERIVCTLAYNHPEITWAPRIYPITALFLHYMKESDAYDCVCALYRCNEEFTQFSETIHSHKASTRVLKDLTKKYAAGVFRFISRSTAPDPPETVFENWLSWIFASFPFDLIVRVTDVYLTEGSKVHYRIAISLLGEFYKYAGRNAESLMSTDSISRAIQVFCSSKDFNPEKIVAKAFSLRGFARNEIKILLGKYQLENEISAERKDGGLVVALTTLFPSGCRSLTREQWHTLFSWIPPRFTVNEPVVLFTTDRDGTSLRTLYKKAEDFEPLLLLVSPLSNNADSSSSSSSSEAVFGAYVSTNLHQRRGHGRNLAFFGTGESFLFSLSPERRKFDWVGVKMGAEISLDASLFIAADDSTLIVGGGGGEGLSLDEELNRGRTQMCKTFDNPPLFDGGDFNCRLVEVIGFGCRASP